MTKRKKAAAIIITLFILTTGIFYLIFNREIKKLFYTYSLIHKFNKEAFTKEFAEKYIYPGQKNIDVQSYRLNIEINFKEKSIKALEKIAGITKGNSLNQIPLNFREGFRLTNVLLNNNKAKFEYKNDHILIEKNNRDTTFEIRIAYEGKPKSLGLGSFVFDKQDGSDYLYTINEPVYASSWFACNDRPDDKAFFQISITTDSSKTSISNGKLIEIRRNTNKKTYVWKTLYPMATYLATIYSGNYVQIQDTVNLKTGTIKIKNFVFPQDSLKALKDLKINKNGIRVFSLLFGGYPFSKEKYGVVEITWPLGGIENQTASGIGNKFFTGAGFFEDLFIHELSHQWWGNAVTLTHWNEIWLNEGFAVYSTALFDEQLYGEKSLVAYLNSKRGDFEKATLENPGSQALFSLTYNKGAWFLHMLRKEIGDSIFFKVLKDYFQTFKYKNVTTQKFKDLTERISHKKLDYFFYQWLNKKGIPVLEIEYSTLKSHTNNNSVCLTIEQKGIYDNYKLKLPFKFINLSSGNIFNDTLFVKSKKTKLIKSFPLPIDSVAIENKDLLVKVNINKVPQ